MAGLALETPQLALPHGAPDGRIEAHKEALSEVQEAAAKLYGQGYQRKQIARILVDHLAGDRKANGLLRTKQERIQAGRNKLRNWERKQEFRDMVWSMAVVKLDMDTPDILSGIASKAKRGRVDAARLALEVTGRHNPKGEDKPTAIYVQIANVPRP